MEKMSFESGVEVRRSKWMVTMVMQEKTNSEDYSD